MCAHTPVHPCRREPCSFPKVPSQPGGLRAGSPRGRTGRESSFLLSPAFGGPNRSSAKGTQHSGSSSRSFTSLPPCSSAHSSITWAAGSWVSARLGPAGVGGLGDLFSRETFGFCPLTGGPGKSLGTEFNEALAQLCPREALGPLSWHRPGAGTKGCPCLSAPSLLIDSGICRRILHVLYTDCIRQCSGPLYVVPAQLPGPLLLYLHSSSSLHWGALGAQLRAQGRGGGPSDGPPATSLPVSQFPCLCFPPGPHGAAGYGQHYQLVTVSPAVICVARLGGQLGAWPAMGFRGEHGQIWA